MVDHVPTPPRRAALTPVERAAQSRFAARDWLLYVLLAALVLVLPLSIQTSGWLPHAGRAVWAAVWAGLAGVWLARSHRRDVAAWLISAGLAIVYCLQAATRILPGISLLWRDLVQAIVQIVQLLSGDINTLPPLFDRSAAHILSQYGIVSQSIGQWVAALRVNATSRDTTILVFAVAMLVWLLTWNATFQLLRHNRALAAILPLAVALLANVSYTDVGMGYVRFFVAVVLLVLVRSHVMRLIGRWGRANVDFSPDLTQNVTTAGASLAAVVLVIALAIPYITYNPAIEFFWNNFGERFEALYGNLDRAFAGRNPLPTPTPAADEGGHELSRAAPLGQGAVMTVRISDPPPPSMEEMSASGSSLPGDYVTQRYWRQRTYDIYTGRGWENSETSVVDLPAGTAWITPTVPGAVLTQTFTINPRFGNPSFAAGQVLQADHGYAVTLRGDDDLVSFSTGISTYTVVSRVAEPEASQLMAAEDDYPDWIQEHYLALPTVPERVQQLASQIVAEAGARTRYEKARAIESYIRAYTYDLRLPPPPRGEDVVDYFLFDAQRGYCDYSATAMTVMLRSIGVAARYASGYGMGSYDTITGAWIVRESNYHAWTEVYFPGYGWIVFEPTPVQRIFSYADTQVVSVLPRPTVVAAAPSPSRNTLGWLWWLGLAGLTAFVVVWPPRLLRRRAADPRDAVRLTYRRLVRQARWAGYMPLDGQTPNEFLRTLAAAIGRRHPDPAHPVANDAAVIEQLYERARYSQAPLEPADAALAEMCGRRLRRLLWPLIFSRPTRALRG